MKKRLFLLIYLLTLLSVFAETYKSNILMQILSSEVDTPYTLEINGDSFNLYSNNDLIKNQTISYEKNFDSKVKIVKTNDYVNNTSEISKYFNGLLTEYDFISDESSFSVINTYDDNGSLLFSTILQNDSETDVVYYVRDVNSGKLLGTKSINSFNWNETNYLVDNNLILTEISDGVYLENDFSINDDNLITYINNGVTYLYSLDGLLLKEETNDSSISYFYENRVLVKSESQSGDNKVISEYINGLLNNSISYKQDIIIESCNFYDSGMVKTLYSGGNPVAEVYYDKNNIKVVDIRYLN